MIRCVIIEDEPLAAKFLEALLVKTGLVEVVGIARNAAWGLTLCSDHRPDAVFLDIRMPGMDGVALAAEFGMFAKVPFLVFTTGHSDRACDAFRLHAVDYLLKPLVFSQVRDAVLRLEALVCVQARRVLPPGSVSAEPVEDRLSVKAPEDDVVRLIPRFEILAAVSRKRRTWIHTAAHEYATYYTLCEIAVWLGDPPFARISRESVVNLSAIEEVVHHGDRQYQVRLRDRLGTCLEASRSGAARLTALIKPSL